MENVIENGGGRPSMDAIPIAGILRYRPDADKDNALCQDYVPSSRV